MKQRGLAVLRGRHWHDAGAPRWLMPVGADVQVELNGTVDDGDRVRAALTHLDAPQGDGEVLLFVLSYEACTSLDPCSPRRTRDASLGPDVVVRRCRIVPPVERLIAGGRRVAPPVPGTHARAAHVERVRRAHEHLLDGVIYQANLAHRLHVEPTSFDDGLAFFLEGDAPPCAAFVDVPGWGSIVSLSPERFVAANLGERVARTFPIKGTRPRGKNPDDDARLLAELCASEKDTAEHVMIVDLLRNDLGKLAVAGGVTVEKLLEVVSVKNVHHLESTIAARLRDDVKMSDLIEATVPGGSITGAPKSSAIDVIHELEDGPRGLYTGVLGIIEGRTLRSSLLIRTWLRPDAGQGSLQVGGGIVVDSSPEAEWQETLDKAALFTELS